MAAATATAPTTADLATFDVTPDEVAAVIAALRQKKADEAKAAEIARIRSETGYPKRLYNSMYRRESVLSDDGFNRLNFYRGVIDVQSPEEEAYLRAACPNRIFEADMPRERACKKCEFVTASSDCWEAHLEFHT